MKGQPPIYLPMLNTHHSGHQLYRWFFHTPSKLCSSGQEPGVCVSVCSEPLPLRQPQAPGLRALAQACCGPSPLSPWMPTALLHSHRARLPARAVTVTSSSLTKLEALSFPVSALGKSFEPCPSGVQTQLPELGADISSRSRVTGDSRPRCFLCERGPAVCSCNPNTKQSGTGGPSSFAV